MPQTVAIACADLHFSHKPPRARANEDWYSVMGDYLTQLESIQDKCDNAPILCAGDVFHTWNEPVQLVNFIGANLPQPFYVIPGQHDLPNHNTKHLSQTALWNLCRQNKARLVDGCMISAGVRLDGFGWKEELREGGGHKLDIALIHKYCWIKGSSYPQAKSEDHARELCSQLRGYDIAIFGDNHIPFYWRGGSRTAILNCGAFLKRTISEKDHEPCVWRIESDGEAYAVKLDTSQDKEMIDVQEHVEVQQDNGEFADELNELTASGLDFMDALWKVAQNKAIRHGVGKFLVEVIEEAKTK